MDRNSQFSIVTIISFFFLMLVGVSTGHAQDAPPKSGDGSRGTQTAVPVEPALQLQRGVIFGEADVYHPETRPERPPGQTRDTRPSGTQDTQPQSSSSSFPGPFRDIQAAVKVQPQNQVNIGSKTPCGSPKCLGEALTTQKPFTSQLDGIGKGSGNVGSPKVMGTAGRARR